jgi:hypothetical protein
VTGSATPPPESQGRCPHLIGCQRHHKPKLCG